MVFIQSTNSPLNFIIASSVLTVFTFSRKYENPNTSDLFSTDLTISSVILNPSFMGFTLSLILKFNFSRTAASRVLNSNLRVLGTIIPSKHSTPSTCPSLNIWSAKHIKIAFSCSVRILLIKDPLRFFITSFFSLSSECFLNRSANLTHSSS